MDPFPWRDRLSGIQAQYDEIRSVAVALRDLLCRPISFGDGLLFILSRGVDQQARQLAKRQVILQVIPRGPRGRGDECAECCSRRFQSVLLPALGRPKRTIRGVLGRPAIPSAEAWPAIPVGLQVSQDFGQEMNWISSSAKSSPASTSATGSTVGSGDESALPGLPPAERGQCRAAVGWRHRSRPGRLRPGSSPSAPPERPAA